MNSNLTVRRKVHFRVTERTRLRLAGGVAPDALPAGSVPRIARLMALAIRFDGLIHEGRIRDQAELAQVGHVTRARITQIMNLLNLAPDIQQAILFLPRTERGRDPVMERQVRSIAAEFDWAAQRRMWAELLAARG